MTLPPDAVRNAVAVYYAAVRHGDIEGIAPLFAADAVMRDPVGMPPAVDDTARRQRYAGVTAAFQSFRIDEERIIVCGDEASARWTARGTAASGKDVTFDGMSTFAFDSDGKISSMSVYFEMGAVAEALRP